MGEISPAAKEHGGMSLKDQPPSEGWERFLIGNAGFIKKMSIFAHISHFVVQ